MCKRRGGAKQERIKKGKTRARKRTCCERCKRRIRRWFCRKIKRCFKKAVFGYPDPRLDDYEIAGYNLGSLKDNLKLKTSKNSIKSSAQTAKKNPTVLTLFKNNRKKSTKSVELKDALAKEFGSPSVSSLIGKVKSFVTDLRERNVFLGLSKDSKLNLNVKDKEKFRKIADKYENKNINYLSLLGDHKILKKRFSLTPSKTEVLKNMLEDYKTKQCSFSKINISKDIKNINDLNKEDFNKLLNRYKSLKEKERNSYYREKLKLIKENILTKDKRISKNQLEFLKSQDSDSLRNFLFLTESKPRLLRSMADDLKRGKFSLTAIPSPLIKERNNFQKENLSNILNYYKSQQKVEHYPFIKQSKLKQFKSDLRAKIGY